MTINIITRQPETLTHPTPLLFVHGAWHGAWCWDEYFLPYFAGHGFACHALDLRGHGGSPNNKALILTGVWDYVADVAQAAAQIEAETGRRPAVIGHSMGGYVVQKYLERHTAPAAMLLASIPSIGTIPFQLRLLRYFPLATLKTLLTLSAYPLVATPDLARRHFFSPSMPRADVERFQARLQNEALRILLDAGVVNLPRPKRIHPTPLLVLAAGGDRVFTIGEEKQTARAYGTTAEVFPDIAHDMMLEAGWQAVADRMIAWLGEQGL